MSKKTVFITESTALDQLIGKIKGHTAKLEGMVHDALMGSAFQAIFHGNTNHLNALVAALGKGVRKTAVAQWALAHMPVVPELDREAAKDRPFRFSRDKLAELAEKAGVELANVKALTAEEAEAVTLWVGNQPEWTEHKEPPLVPEKWDAMDALRKFIATAKSMQSKKVHIEHAELLGAVANLLPSTKDEQPAEA